MDNVKKQFEQLKKMNEGCGNGFKINESMLRACKTKELIKDIDIAQNKVIRATIFYYKAQDGETPMLSINLYERTSMYSNILVSNTKTFKPIYIAIGAPKKRKYFKSLKLYSHAIIATNDYILKVYNQAIS